MKLTSTQVNKLAATLTTADVIALAAILDSIGKHVRWVDYSGDIREGIARHLVNGPRDYGFPAPDADIRDRYLRITAWGGLDYVVPIRKLMELSAQGGYAVDND